MYRFLEVVLMYHNGWGRLEVILMYRFLEVVLMCLKTVRGVVYPGIFTDQKKKIDVCICKTRGNFHVYLCMNTVTYKKIEHQLNFFGLCTITVIKFI